VDVKQLIRELAEHAIKKKGACQAPDARQENVFEYPDICLAADDTLWTQFFDVRSDSNYDEMIEPCDFTTFFAHMPVLASQLREHQRIGLDIKESKSLERDGHVYMEVPLNSDSDVAFLKSLIDESYTLVWNKLASHERLIIDLSELPFVELQLLDRLIDIHGLTDHREDIHLLIRKAILLRTKSSSQTEIALGASKVGGEPDLPTGIKWPIYQNGKPLAFLAQLDLKQIGTLDLDLAGLPKSGLLSIFSVWGWQDSEGCDPEVPDDGTEKLQEKNNWTVIFHSESQTVLDRRKTPPGVNCFKEAEIEPISIASLPNHLNEPAVAKLRISAQDYDRFYQLLSDYRSLQMGHWLNNPTSSTSHHLLGGYALLQQGVPEYLLEKQLSMFLQIGSDSHTDMCWGDCGELTFYVDPIALRDGRFERIWVEYQCG